MTSARCTTQRNGTARKTRVGPDSRGQKITGRGIDVAVIDTGVSPVEG